MIQACLLGTRIGDLYFWLVLEEEGGGLRMQSREGLGGLVVEGMCVGREVA